MRILRIVGPGLVLITLSTMTGMSALAREPSAAWNDVLAIELQSGIGAPTGLAGLALDVTPHPRVSLNAGAGRGLYAMQLAGMARVRPFFIRSNIAPGIGAGVSGGDTGTLAIGFADAYLRFDRAIWANGELFFEYRRGPFHLRPFLGYARMVSHSGCTYIPVYDSTARSQPCSAIEQTRLDSMGPTNWIYYTGLALGWSLF
jgi:hypothetical protein